MTPEEKALAREVEIEEKPPTQYCVLCRCAVPEPAEDHFCHGCDSYICGDHFGDPWGSHEPEEHDA